MEYDLRPAWSALVAVTRIAAPRCARGGAPARAPSPLRRSGREGPQEERHAAPTPRPSRRTSPRSPAVTGFFLPHASAGGWARAGPGAARREREGCLPFGGHGAP